MRILSTRSTVATSLAAVLIAGMAGCGSKTEVDSAAAPAPAAAPAAAAPAGADAAAAAPTAASSAAATDTMAGMAATGSASTGNPFADIRTAAQHMPGTADALTGGIATALKLGELKSDASDLRAGLTYLFTEHVYIAGIAVATAYHAGATSDAFTAAKTAVLANAQDIEDGVTKIVGADKGKTFKGAFDAHIGDFINYAVGAKTAGAAGAKMKKDAVTSLKAYAKTAGEFFSSATGGAVSAKAYEKEVLTHITTLAAAVDDFAAGKTSAYGKLKTAADHMSMEAKDLTIGIAKATKMTGKADDKVADTRALLTGELVSHVYLAGVAVFTAYADKESVKGEQFKAAAAALDTNSVDLSKAVGSVSTAKDGATFLQVWRSHIGNFVSYAVGEATSDEAAKAKALKDLDGYRTSAGDFFSKITNGAIKSEDVATALKAHIATLAGAIDSLKKALVTSS